MTVERFETTNRFGTGTVLSWASILEDNTREQAEAVSRVPIVDGHVALMPDAHFGFGPPVGSVIVTRGGVMPYAVGVDIGCGMIAVCTDLERATLAGLEGHLLGEIRDRIPAGMGHAHDGEYGKGLNFTARYGVPPGILPGSGLTDKKGPLSDKQASLTARIVSQFGTLGGGNHFVEMCEDADGFVWLVLHSGSRGIGNVLATAHVGAAERACRENRIELEKPREFAYLVTGTDGYRAYIEDMTWAQTYAYENRNAMMNVLLAGVREIVRYGWDEVERINCHHNYAEERPDGSVLTRKGAIDASAGKRGIIPGSMGAATYIVCGLGNDASYRSSSHGAGRVMSRRAARESIGVDTFTAQMKGKTWLDLSADDLLDEAPDAYKPIDRVMKDSVDLVRPTAVLHQFINFKGVDRRRKRKATATGRMPSDPNLQNVSVRTETGREIRAAFAFDVEGESR